MTRLADLIVPEVFDPYVQQTTEEKSRLVQSGALARDAELDAKLVGGGLTFHAPSYDDLENEDEDISSDQGSDSTPGKITTLQEIAVRLSRNKSWGSADLNVSLTGSDPLTAIGDRVSYYWTRRVQKAFIALMTGVFADNDAAPAGTEHVQGDLSHDISGVSYTAGVTDFSAEAFIDAAVTMGDSMDDLGLVFVHSVVYARMQKNNLIDFIPDSRGETTIPTFLGRVVVKDDGMPVTGGVYQTWLFGAGAVRWGVGAARVPSEVSRKAEANQGGGEEVLHNRVEWCLHPAGHAYVGTSPVGGPSNAATANNLAHAGSWQRVFTERKQIKIARLITRES